MFSLHPLWIYLIAINLVTFGVFVVDKVKAMSDQWRVPEARLMGLTAVGGSLGALLGMAVARHKIRKPKFFIGVPALLVLHVAIIAWLMKTGLL